MQDNNFIKFIEFLKVRLHSALPARNAHVKMAPMLNEQAFRSFEPEKEPKHSAVLIIIYNNNNEPGIVLTLRSSQLKNHSGQICFPGGRRENLETLIETAIREAVEEINLNTDNIEILGNLSDLYVPPSNNLITPVAAVLKEKQDFTKNEDEVEEIFFVDLDDLAGNNFFKKEPWDFKGINIMVPHWTVHNTTPLWGATAMIISELLELYKEFKQNKNE